MWFLARSLGYLKTIHSNREIDRIIVNRLRQLEIEELKALRSKKEDKYHNLIAELHKQVQLLESIEFYIKVKFIRILDNNRGNMEKLKLRKTDVLYKRKDLHSQTRKILSQTKLDRIQYTNLVSQFKQQDDDLQRLVERIDDMIRISKDMAVEIKKTCKRNIRDFRNVYYKE